jgi:hypothetical protein
LLTKCFHRLDAIAATLGIVSAVFIAVFGLAMILADMPMAASVVSVLERFAFKVLLVRYGVFFALGMILWLGFEYGFGRNRIMLGLVLAVFGAFEIAIQAASSSTQSVFISAIPPFEAAMIPILVWSAGMVVLIASVFFRTQIGDLLKPRRALVTKLGLLTFPLYLNHYTLGRVMVYSLISAHLERSVVFAISLGLVCGSSWLIMMIPEPAIQARLRKLLKLDASAAQPILATK